MPRAVRWLDEAYDQLQELPGQLYADAQAAAGRLLADPHPPGAEPFKPVPDTWRLDTGHVSVFYRVTGDEIDIVRVRPNT
jgi:plasmid stabilization system protein ParE